MKILTRKIILLQIFFTLCDLPVQNGHKGFTARFTNLKCFPNLKWFANTSCQLKAVSRHKQIVNIYTVPLKPLTDIYAHVQSFKRYSGWRPWVISGKVNVCEALAGKFNILHNIFKPTIEKFSNVNHTCPYDHPLIGKDIDLDYLDFGASIIPTGFYRIVFTFYKGKELLFKNIYEGEVKEN